MTTAPGDWREGLPELRAEHVRLRELRISDAGALFTELTSPEVKRFMWAPPPSAEAFAHFIQWAREERATGKYICYGIVPIGEDDAIGVFELRQLQPGFVRGELGFVTAARLWDSRILAEGASLVLEFGFRVVKIHRIEARAIVDNDRANAALKYVGARREGRLRDAFLRDGLYVDQYLWAILDTDWARRESQPSDK